MGSTTPYAIPYPEPTDPVRDGAAAAKATATRIAAVLGLLANGGQWGFRAGSSVVTTDNTNGIAIVNINPQFVRDIPGAPGMGCIPIAMNGDGLNTSLVISCYPNQSWLQLWACTVKGMNGLPLLNTTVRINWIALGMVDG